MLGRSRTIFFAGAAVVASLFLSGFERGQTTRFSGTIAFVASTGDRSDLYVIGVDGKGRRQLTHDAQDEGSPTWAPNGKSIAFVATKFRVGRTHDESVSTISVVLANGSKSKRRALFGARSGQLAVGDLSWSPDGRRIAFTWFRSDKFQVWLLRVARRSIASVATGAQQPTWAPDNRRLAYATVGGGIRIANVETRKTRRVPGAFDSSCPVWSPNARWIAVCAPNQGGTNQFSSLEVMSPIGARHQQLVKRSFVRPVAWSPNSDAILFLGSDRNSSSDRALFIVTLRDRHVTRVAGTEGAIDSAAWHR